MEMSDIAHNFVSSIQIQKVMSRLLDIIKKPGIIGKYINGVINAKWKKEQIYQLAFNKEIDRAG